MTHKKEIITLARLSSGNLVNVTVLRSMKTWFRGLRHLVSFQNNTVDDNGAVVYSNLKTEWVSDKDLFKN